MCAIAGLVSLDNRPLDVTPLGKMLDVVAHRGPDGQGLATFDLGSETFRTGNQLESLQPDNGRSTIALGHRRLAIIDLSAAANQPMSYDGDRLWIVFNGAIYNYIELRKELTKRGQSFRTQSDTEVILAAYRQWGLQCVDHLNGMFAFSILDRERQRLVCFRDRLGIKPFYYRIENQVFSFASEIKQLLELPGPRCINPQLAFDFLMVGSTDHRPETCFDGIHQLQPSHCLVIQLGQGNPQLEDRQYWQPHRDTQLQSLSSEAAAEQVESLVKDSVALRMRCDVAIGSCLSGGLDSSSVVALMSAIRREQGLTFQQHTFTYQPDEAAIDESGFAQLVARQVDAESHLVRITPDEILTNLDRHLWHEEEPIGDLSHFARAQVMSAARRSGVTVMLDGQGGDELFLGYERYYVPAFLRFAKEQGLRKALGEFRAATRHSKLSASRLLLFTFLFGHPTVRAQFFRNRVAGWMNPAFLKEHSVLAVARAHHLGLDTWEMQRRDMLEIQLPHLLRHEDRDSMASSIEARTPLLDHRLVEFVMSLGLNTKIRDGWTKYVLRKAMRNHLPAEILWRRDKLGFAVPQTQWMQAILRDAKLLLLQGDLACEPFVDAGRLRKRIQADRMDNKALWRIMSLEKTMRIFGLQA